MSEELTGNPAHYPVPEPAPVFAAAPVSAGEKVACPNCGATTSRWVPERGHMVCDTCRSYFDIDSGGVANLVSDDIVNLRGFEIAPGAGEQVDPELETDVLTLACPTCGAEEVVHVDTNLTTFRCHWCRNNLTLSDKIANGARPDGIIPFSLPREQAQSLMERFLKKRRFFANRAFIRDYCLESIAPVYFPYFMVDVNAKSYHQGKGAHLVRTYTRGSGKNQTRYWDYDIYQFERQFDLYVNDLLVQANAESANLHDRSATNNILNAMAPWPATATLKGYDPLFLQGGYRAERRSLNINDVRPKVGRKVRDLSMRQANATMEFYDHGIRYEDRDDCVQPVGERWVSVLAPVWIFGYLQKKRSGANKLHYVAVNGVTGKITGSVPLSQPRLWTVAVLAQIAGMVVGSAIAIGNAFWWLLW